MNKAFRCHFEARARSFGTGRGISGVQVSHPWRSLVRCGGLGMTTVALLLGLLVSVAALAQPQKKPDPAEPLNLNTATVEQLQKLPGIGPTTAKAIVRFREKSGPFRRVEDLLVIRGITKKKLKKMRPYVTIKPVPQQAESPK